MDDIQINFFLYLAMYVTVFLFSMSEMNNGKATKNVGCKVWHFVCYVTKRKQLGKAIMHFDRNLSLCSPQLEVYFFFLFDRFVVKLLGCF